MVATGNAHWKLPSRPEIARAAMNLPYDELLPRLAVFVTNGG